MRDEMTNGVEISALRVFFKSRSQLSDVLRAVVRFDASALNSDGYI